MGTQTQFNDLLRDIEPSATTKGQASAAHGPLRKFLAADDEFAKVHVDTFLSGSYARDTSIRPRTKDGVVSRPDVDIIVVTNHKLTDDPAEVLALLKKTLKKEYELDKNPHTRSVGVLTDKVEMDVVPIIAPYGMTGSLYLPDRKVKEWIQTNPPGHTEWSTQTNKAAGGRFKPLVKLVKWWRRENPTVSKRPKGFVIECVVADCMSYSEKNYAALFVGTLESIVSKYAPWVSLGLVPAIADPSLSGNSVTTSLSFDAFKGFYNKAKEHAQVGREAIDESDEEKALAKWRKIFPNFPKSGGRSAAAGLLAPAANASVYSFPNQPVVPRGPGGFA